MKKILLTGASGYVGMKLYSDLKNQGYEVIGIYNKSKLNDDFIKADLTDEDEVKNLINEVKPDIIIHTAAEAHSKDCEENPEYAKKINVESTKFLVNAAKNSNLRFIHLSTFGCFNPVNVYCKTKLEAENLVEQLDNYVVLRASLIFGLSPNTTSRNFFNDLINSIKNKEILEADTSWTCEVTFLDHLSEVISKLVENDSIKNLMIPVNVSGVVSKYEIASNIGNAFGIEVSAIDQKRIIPLPEFDHEILQKLSLPAYSYDECLQKVIIQLKEQIN